MQSLRLLRILIIYMIHTPSTSPSHLLCFPDSDFVRRDFSKNRFTYHPMMWHKIIQFMHRCGGRTRLRHNFYPHFSGEIISNSNQCTRILLRETWFSERSSQVIFLMGTLLMMSCMVIEVSFACSERVKHFQEGEAAAAVVHLRIHRQRFNLLVGVKWSLKSPNIILTPSYARSVFALHPA